MNIASLIKDKYGVKLKFIDRTCKMCRKYPCFSGIEKCACNFAKYGCRYYLEPFIHDKL